ncbi:MAG: asparagine--tRNA ligase [Thermoprotei archaeon]|nr:MAG: asparagine--tRNA ligase [Thermoprotei archaeon]
MEYVPVRKVFEEKPVGKEVALRGWVYRVRVQKNHVFVVLRDSTGIIQVVVEDTNPAFDEAEKASIESSVEVRGLVKEDPRAPGGLEVRANDFKIISLAEPFPITKDASREFLLDVRHLWVRSRRMNAILKIRHEVFRCIHEFFTERSFVEVQAPMFITVAVEGGATLFTVDYFGRKDIYLTQSAQFYLEALIYSLERVYTIAPSFRAEKSRTRRHLTEFWHAEAEVAWYRLNDVLKLEEDLISYIVDKVLERRMDELKLLKRRIEALENVKAPFYRLSYDEAIEMLQGKGFEIEWGEDLGADEERALTLEFDKPVFLYGYPEQAKAFYHKNDPSRPEVTLSADLLAPEGYGEIIGGGERIENYDELIDKIRRFGLNPDDYGWYIDLRRYGSVPHAGFGLGVDRLVMWICGLDHIIDAIPFPRTIRRTYP